MRAPISLPLFGLSAVALLTWGCMAERETDRSTTETGSVTSASEARDAVRRQSAHMVTMWPSENLDSMMTLFADDAVLLFPDMPGARGKPAIREHLAGAFGSLSIESIDTQIDTIEVFDDVAYEWGTYRERYTETGKPQTQEEGRYLIRWERQDDGAWRVTRFTANTIRKGPAAGDQAR
jgi:uncharacterized protein (TIGR02246 family)